MIKKGFLLASFAIGVFANIFAQDTLSFKKTRDKNIYVGTFIKYYKISQLIHTQSIAN